MSTKKVLGIGDWAVDDYAGMFQLQPRVWSVKLGIEIEVEDQDVCIEHLGCDLVGFGFGGGCSTSTVYVPLEVLAEVLRRNGYRAEHKECEHRDCGPNCLEPPRSPEPISPPPDEARERAEKAEHDRDVALENFETLFERAEKAEAILRKLQDPNFEGDLAQMISAYFHDQGEHNGL